MVQSQIRAIVVAPFCGIRKGVPASPSEKPQQHLHKPITQIHEIADKNP
jgi:hypothetical protein